MHKYFIGKFHEKMHNRTMTKMVTAKVKQYTSSTIFSTFSRSHDYIILDRNDGEKTQTPWKNSLKMRKIRYCEIIYLKMFRNNVIPWYTRMDWCCINNNWALHACHFSLTCHIDAYASQQTGCTRILHPFQGFLYRNGSSTHTHTAINGR